MAAAIPDFLQSAASLYQQASRAESRVGEDLVIVHDVPRLVREFQDLAARLTPEIGSPEPLGGGIAAPPTPSTNLSKACWKLAKDILLRLRGLDSTRDQEDAAPGDPALPSSTKWPAKDVEVFGMRLSDVRGQWNTSQLSNKDNVVDVSDSLARLKVFSVHDATADEQIAPANVETDAKGRKPARPAPAGLLNDFILESISFRSMRNREEAVADAHENTFDWIFKPPRADQRGAKNDLGDHFARWLASDELGSIYWVTGKPGSGKSTLMRYISEHPSTLKLLKAWAGREDLVKANFYFWTSGSEEQRSQTGLLRYLLHQLLSHDLSLMPKVFPQLWQQLSRMTAKERIKLSLEWTVPNLMDAFRRFLEHALPTMKICLFVDGLDEFDGDHRGIIHFFRELAEGKSKARMKLCLSSRPWEVFEQAFESTVPNLKLQDLTNQDMVQYVHDNLRQGRDLKKLFNDDQKGFHALIRQIVAQADGVFLWIRLVVRKVRETFDQTTATVGEMQAFVRTLPTELDELFDMLLFQKQSAAELAESSSLFQLVQAREVVADFIKDESANALTVWEFAFALHERDDETALHGEVREIFDDEIIDRCGSAASHILSRSVGLLEIYSRRARGNLSKGTRFDESPAKMARKVAMNTVTYLHRTVRDYLMLGDGVWTRLTSHSPTGFDGHLRLLRSHILRLKHSLEEIEHHRRMDEWYPDIALSLTHCRYIQNDANSLRTPLVNELDKTMSWYWLARSGDPYDHWARSCFGSYEQRKGNKIIIPKPFIVLCTKFGLEHYVLDVLKDLVEPSKNCPFPFLLTDEDSEDEEEDEDEDERVIIEPEVEETPLLMYALEFLTSRQKAIFPLSSPSFVASLLTSPHLQAPGLANFIGTPNTKYTPRLVPRKNATPWVMVLRHLRDAKRRGWIDPFDTDPSGTERWIAIVRLLIDTGHADLNAFLEFDGWDPEAHALDVLAGPEQLGAIGDWWLRSLGNYVKAKKSGAEN
ncbi:hypothetical protein GQ53DRAFT_741136 [Thozetella sp. PMI_491]|nr:hypothetical protein GQ53DRAFT_741136 [Thozetella sp. PMI_491]